MTPPRPFFSPVLALAMTAMGVNVAELTRVQAEFHQRCGALAHVAALALQARGRPCDVTALRKLIEADAMALAAAGPLMSEVLTDLEAAVAKWITAGCVSVVHRTWAAAPPSGVADPASVHAIELRFNEPGNWVGALVSCTGGLTILEWPAATAPAATAAVTRGAEAFARARQEMPRFIDAMREARVAVPGGRAPNESLRERAGIGVDDIGPAVVEVASRMELRDALKCTHIIDPMMSRCTVCGVAMMIAVDLAACEDKYLGDPGTTRYVAADEASPEALVIDFGPIAKAAGRAADKMREAFERAQPAMQALASKVSAAAAKLDFLHPAGRCTCFGEGRCEWCEMNRRRELREARRPRRQPCTCTPDTICGPCYQRGYDDANPQERQLERARKRDLHQRKQARRRRRGY